MYTETKESIDPLQTAIKDMGHNQVQQAREINQVKDDLRQLIQKVNALYTKIDAVYEYYGVRE